MRLCVQPYALWRRVVWLRALQYLDRHEALRVDVDRSARLAGYHVLSARAAVAPAAARAALRALQDNALLRSITAAATGRRALKCRLRGQHHYVEGLMEAGTHCWQALVDALVAAAASGEPGCVRPLLAAGGVVDGVSKWGGCTPLMAACPESDDTCTRLLRQSGARVDGRGGGGRPMRRCDGADER